MCLFNHFVGHCGHHLFAIAYSCGKDQGWNTCATLRGLNGPIRLHCTITARARLCPRCSSMNGEYDRNMIRMGFREYVDAISGDVLRVHGPQTRPYGRCVWDNVGVKAAIDVFFSLFN